MHVGTFVSSAVLLTDEHIQTVASKLHGAAGLGGTDAPTLKTWLLRYRHTSATLRRSVASLGSWLATEPVPWAAIRALVSNRLIAFGKPDGGTRPIAIGHIWRRLLAKAVILPPPAPPTNSAAASKLASKAVSTLPENTGTTTPKTQTLDSFKWMPATPSTKATALPCYGWPATNGPPEPASPSTAIVTAPSSSSTPSTMTSRPCTAKSESPRAAPSQ